MFLYIIYYVNVNSKTIRNGLELHVIFNEICVELNVTYMQYNNFDFVFVFIFDFVFHN